MEKCQLCRNCKWYRFSTRFLKWFCENENSEMYLKITKEQQDAKCYEETDS